MSFEQVASIGQEVLVLSLMLVAPVVIVSLFFGLLISILQTVTGIQEQTLSFAPRIVAAAGIIIAMLPWYLAQIQSFTQRMFQMATEVSL